MKKIAAFFLIIGIFSCTDLEKSPKPENLYTKDKMAAVLTELYLVEGAIASNKASYLKTGIVPSSYIYEKFETDSISFKENLDFYTDRIEDYLIILDQVQENLKTVQDSVNARQEKLNKEQQKKLPKNQPKDSLKVFEKSTSKQKAL
jgi:hypothetical protein